MKNKEYVIKQVYSIDSLQVLESGNKWKIRMQCTVPNPCYEYSHIETEHQADSLKIRVFAKKLKKINCIQVIGKIKTDIELPDFPAGVKEFIFEGQSSKKSVILAGS